jgi:iron(III) transport system permease protein
VVWGMTGVAAVLLALPFAAVALEFLLHPGAALQALASVRLFGLLSTTLARSAAVTALAVLLGLPLGVLLFRTDLPGRRFALAAHVLPLFISPFLLALGVAQLFGRTGVFGSEWTAAALYGEPGAIAIQVLAFTPIVTALVGLGLSSIDASLEDAARVSAPPLRVLTGVLLPLSRPSLALGALLVFALSVSELGVPMFARVRAYPAAVFARLGGMAYEPGEAVGLALPLLAVALCLLAVERRIARRMRAVRGLRRDLPPIPLGRGRWVVAIAVLTTCCAAFMPWAGLVVRATPALSVVPRWVGGSILTSLLSATLAATVVTVLATVLGYSLGRGRLAGRLIDAVATLSFVTPAAVLGIGLITVWNHRATSWVYGSMGILVVGWSARYAVLALRPVALGVGLTPASLEDAARVAGARFLRLLFFVVTPLQRRALAAGWLFALAFSLRDLETAVMYYPPGNEPLAVRVFTLEANGPVAVVAALALVQMLLSSGVVAAGTWLLRRPHA